MKSNLTSYKISISERSFDQNQSQSKIYNNNESFLAEKVGISQITSVSNLFNDSAIYVNKKEQIINHNNSINFNTFSAPKEEEQSNVKSNKYLGKFINSKNDIKNISPIKFSSEIKKGFFSNIFKPKIPNNSEPFRIVTQTEKSRYVNNNTPNPDSNRLNMSKYKIENINLSGISILNNNSSLATPTKQVNNYILPIEPINSIKKDNELNNLSQQKKTNSNIQSRFEIRMYNEFQKVKYIQTKDINFIKSFMIESNKKYSAFSFTTSSPLNKSDNNLRQTNIITNKSSSKLTVDDYRNMLNTSNLPITSKERTLSNTNCFEINNNKFEINNNFYGNIKLNNSQNQKIKIEQSLKAMNELLPQNIELVSFLLKPQILKIYLNKVISSKNSSESSSNSNEEEEEEEEESEEVEDESNYFSENEKSLRSNMKNNRKLFSCLFRIQPTYLSYKLSLEHYVIAYTIIKEKDIDQGSDKSDESEYSKSFNTDIYIDLYKIKNCLYQPTNKMFNIIIDSVNEDKNKVSFYIEDETTANKIKEGLLYLSHLIKLKAVYYKVKKSN